MPKKREKEAPPVALPPERRSIPVDFIRDNQWNGHRAADDDLVASVRESGILNNLVVRPVPGTDRTGLYELVAGARRLDAARKAGITEVPCVVLDLGDTAAREMTIVENLQRENLHPIDEARAIADLIGDGNSVDEVAAKIGKTKAFVTRRAKLATLAPQVVEILGDDIRRCSIRALELLATMPEEKQIDFAENWGVEIDPSMVMREIAGERNVISGAPFDCSDAGLCPEAGACATCPKRTGAEPLLFDDLAEIAKEDRCLDPECFARKTDIHVAREESLLREKHGEKLMLVANTIPYGEEGADLRKRGVIEMHRVDKVKKSTPGARPALIVHGHDAGKVVYVKATAHVAAEADASDGKKEPSLKEKRAALNNRRHAWVAEKLTSIIDRSEFPAIRYCNDAEMCRIAAAFGGFSHEGDGMEFWEISGGKDGNAMDCHRRIWDASKRALRCFLQVFRVGDIDDDFVGRATLIAEIAGEDYAELFKQACEEIPEPKAWNK